MEEKVFGKALKETLEENISDFEEELSEKLKNIIKFYNDNQFDFCYTTHTVGDDEEKLQNELIDMCDDLMDRVDHFFGHTLEIIDNFLGEKERKLIIYRLKPIRDKVAEIIDNIKETVEDFEVQSIEYETNQDSNIENLDCFMDELKDELKNCDIIKNIKGELKDYIKDE